MARWGNHRGRVEAARRRITVENGYIDLSLPTLVRAERAAWTVPTSAAERAADLKGPGLSTVRRDSFTTTTRWLSGRRRRRTRTAPASGAVSAG